MKVDDLVNYSFKNYNGDNLDEDVSQFIVDFCEDDSRLDKRINNLFSTNQWVYNYCEKEDFKQEVITTMLTKARKKFPYITGEHRLKYFNTLVSSVICNMFKDKIDSAGAMVLKTNMDIDEDLQNNDDNDIEDIFNLFIGEQLEREIVRMYYEGYNETQIKEALNLGRFKFEKIRDEIRRKLKEEYL